ncbi:Folliculin-interacting protein 2 [Orchesella cincta]|uniref:Folliculin-interacting protein 2 n=1 Tax=Orchesella cincta TaxID=48709 RepID=A0A1D2M9B8_ORCCI|nr:Folliculin-interacting protein 2 [Orchesella cincta]
MESPSRGSSSSSSNSTPRRNQPPNQQSSSGRNTPEGGGGTPTRTGNAFSRFLSQLKNIISEGSLIEPTSDVEPGLDHCCSSSSRCHYGLPVHHDHLSSNLTFPAQDVSSRLIVYRDCDRRGRKILFDSDHVSSDYRYLQPSDPKLLKELGEYVFGCVPLASASSPAMDKRFCKWKVETEEKTTKTLYIWSKIFELGSSTAKIGKQDRPSSASDYSDHSSGYESASSSGKTFSLPLFQQRSSSSSSRGGGSSSSSPSSFPQTRSLPGRIDSYKTNLALVWILSQTETCSTTIPFLNLSPLVEKLMLSPLSSITKTSYHNSSHFVTSLKNVSTSLSRDLRDFLSNPHVVNLSLVKPPLGDMVNVKLVCKFLELLLLNMDNSSSSKIPVNVVLNLKKWTEVKALLYFFKMFLKTSICKCGLLSDDYQREREQQVETGTDVVSQSGGSSLELDGVDSGIELGTNTTDSSSISRFQTVSTSSMSRGRKWSIVSEEESSELGSSHDEGCEGRVSFHLGDADNEQSEARLALGEVDLSRLRGQQRRRLSTDSSSSTEGGPQVSPVKRPPLEVKLSLKNEPKVRDSCPVKFSPCFYCNGVYITENQRFNPYYFCQILAKPGNPVSFEYEYVSFMKIIELYGSGQVRSFNLDGNDGVTTSLTSSGGSGSTSGGSEEDQLNGEGLTQKIKEFVEGYVALSKVTNDGDKLNNFATFQMEQIRDFL